jgi:serine/threonine protein kinase
MTNQNGTHNKKQMDLPKRLGDYELLELVGSGGIGQVFKAKHIKTHQIVALKRLHENYQNDRKLLGLFHKEIMIHSRVSHRHCVKCFDCDLTPGNAHIVTQFVEGQNTYMLVRQNGPLPPIVAACITLDMLQGLEHLHCLDIIHSDLTPSNVLVANNGLTLLVDFGLSCMPEVENYEGIIVGTPGYQAPERIDHGPISTLTDIYCAGIILWELLSGQRLFYGYAANEIRARMKNPDLGFINTGDKNLNAVLRNTLSTALAFKPEKRFQTPRDFMYAVYLALKQFGITHTRRATLQWLVDMGLTNLPPDAPMQNIYAGKTKPSKGGAFEKQGFRK